MLSLWQTPWVHAFLWYLSHLFPRTCHTWRNTRYKKILLVAFSPLLMNFESSLRTVSDQLPIADGLDTPDISDSCATFGSLMMDISLTKDLERLKQKDVLSLNPIERALLQALESLSDS
jgi:hypothetical protein